MKNGEEDASYYVGCVLREWKNEISGTTTSQLAVRPNPSRVHSPPVPALKKCLLGLPVQKVTMATLDQQEFQDTPTTGDGRLDRISKIKLQSAMTTLSCLRCNGMLVSIYMGLCHMPVGTASHCCPNSRHA